MKNISCLVTAALIALAAAGCREGAHMTILFTGDERGWIVPAG